MTVYKCGTGYVLKDECVEDDEKWVKILEIITDKRLIVKLGISKRIVLLKTKCIEREMNDEDKQEYMANSLEEIEM